MLLVESIRYSNACGIMSVLFAATKRGRGVDLMVEVIQSA
jgi:hypothetical protein